MLSMLHVGDFYLDLHILCMSRQPQINVYIYIHRQQNKLLLPVFLKVHCVDVLPSGQINCGAHSLTLPLPRLPVIYGCLFRIKEDVVDNKSVNFHKLRLQTLETMTFGIASRKINSKSKKEIMCLYCDVNKADGKAF